MQNHHWLNGRRKENCEAHSSEDKDKLLTTPLTAWVGRNNPALIPHVAGTLFKLLQAYLDVINHFIQYLKTDETENFLEM